VAISPPRPRPRHPATPLIAGAINLGHLDWLSPEVAIGGEPTLFTHIYAEAPDFGWIGAPGEGIAALDDVARAALVYLDFWRATGEPRALGRARAALNFVLALDAGGGAFYNFFLDYGGTINRGGVTSRDGLDWWTGRALGALARGHGAFLALDPPYAARLRAAYCATEALLAARLGAVGRFATARGLRAPAWLPADSAALAALATLALADFQAVAPNERTRGLIVALADGLCAFQLGGPGEFPWGLHPHSLDAPLPWHSWGSHEAQALARAGRLLGRPDWIASARREVDGFFAWQLTQGHIFTLDPLPLASGQQAYAINCLVQAALECFGATGDPAYARMAGLHASWFTGNNAAGRPMYDPATGRGYDGIDRDGAASPHAGAESTIEALLALQAVVVVPEAARFLHHRAQRGARWQRLHLDIPVGQGRRDGAAAPFGGAFTLAEAGEYLLYLASPGRDAGAATARPRAVRLDAAPPLAIPPAPAGRDLPWLDLLTSKPMRLAAGPHRLRLEGGPAELLLQPAHAARRFAGPDGDAVGLDLDLTTGALRWSA
jgi:hypothetical protein